MTDASREAWDALAPAYDTLTAFHDHDAWAAQLDALAGAGGQSGRRLLDVGCGTGSSTAALRARGYRVAGVDLSPRMLDRARDKLGPDVSLYCHDMRSLPRLGSFDAVWSISDAINFLLDEADLVAAFTGLRRNLAPGGRVVFDVDTLASFRTLYTSLLVMPSAAQVVIFEGSAGEDELLPGSLAEATIDILEPTSPPWWRRVRAVHRQRHHDRPTIERALQTAGLHAVAVWGTDGAGGSEQPLDEARHNKAVYIAQSAAPTPEGR